MKRVIAGLLIGAVSLMAENVYATFDVEAKNRANLSPNVGGIIKEIYVEVGTVVNRGQQLVRLDNDKQKLSLDLSKVSLEKAKLSFNNSEKTFKRYSKIKDVIDKEQYDRYEFDKNIKKQDLSNAKTNVALARVQYEDTFIEAPFSGKISGKYLDEGNSVDTKNPVLEIVDDSEVKLVLSFDEKYWRDVKVGQKFTYQVDGDKSKREGVISKVYPTANPKNRKIKAEVITTGVIPGLFGDGFIAAE